MKPEAAAHAAVDFDALVEPPEGRARAHRPRPDDGRPRGRAGHRPVRRRRRRRRRTRPSAACSATSCSTTSARPSRSGGGTSSCCAMSPEELVEERDAIGGLVLDPRRPPVAVARKIDRLDLHLPATGVQARRFVVHRPGRRQVAYGARRRGRPCRHRAQDRLGSPDDARDHRLWRDQRRQAPRGAGQARPCGARRRAGRRGRAEHPPPRGAAPAIRTGVPAGGRSRALGHDPHGARPPGQPSRRPGAARHRQDVPRRSDGGRGPPDGPACGGHRSESRCDPEPAAGRGGRRARRGRDLPRRVQGPRLRLAARTGRVGGRQRRRRRRLRARGGHGVAARPRGAPRPGSISSSSTRPASSRSPTPSRCRCAPPASFCSATRSSFRRSPGRPSRQLGLLGPRAPARRPAARSRRTAASSCRSPGACIPVCARSSPSAATTASCVRSRRAAGGASARPTPSCRARASAP